MVNCVVFWGFLRLSRFAGLAAFGFAVFHPCIPPLQHGWPCIPPLTKLKFGKVANKGGLHSNVPRLKTRITWAVY